MPRSAVLVRPEPGAIGQQERWPQAAPGGGVPVLPGHEDVHDERDLVAALVRLKSANPGLENAVVKRNDGFAGMGNAVFGYAGAPMDDLESWIGGELAADEWTGRRDRLRKVGGVVESYLRTPESSSPSAQLEIRPDGRVRVVSAHDQLVGGQFGQAFAGCRFPAADGRRARVRDLALRTGRVLAEQGVRGPCSVDFVATGDQVYALEINLRMGGTTAPFMFLHGSPATTTRRPATTWPGRPATLLPGHRPHPGPAST